MGPGTGTSPLPIILGYFSGLSGTTVGGNPTTAANYTAANFRSSTYFNTLNPLNANPLAFLSTPGFGLSSGSNVGLASAAFASRRNPVAQGGLGLFPINQFVVNGSKLGGAFIMDNGSQTYYDAVTFELRRRFSKGLLIQSSYTFGKALGNTYASSAAAFDQPSSLR